MAHVKPILDTRTARKDGTYPIKLSLTHKGKTVFVGIDIAVYDDQWSGGLIIDHPKASGLNKVIRAKLIQAENEIINLSASGQINRLSVAQLKERIFSDGEQHPGDQVTLIDHFDKYISRIKNSRTKEIYSATKSKISQYRPDLPLSEVNISFLKSFDLFLANSCGVNSRSIHLRNIRAVLNDAIDEEIISLVNYPFRKFKIKKEATRKRSLTIDQIKLLRDYPVQDHQRKYRDLFMLSFYLIGINAIDLLELRHSDYSNGRIEYKRAKTGTLYSIEVLPEADELIKRYAGENYLLNTMDHYTNYRDFISRWNETLKEIGTLEWIMNRAKLAIHQKKNKKKITPLFPDITTYWARHTWATVAASLDIPKETIFAALGHKIGSEITSIYIDFDLKKVDEANKKVLKAIN